MRPSQTVRRPRAALLLERAVVLRMPIAREKNGESPRHKAVEIFRPHREKGCTAGDTEGTAGKKVILDVDEDQRVVGVQCFNQEVHGRWCRPRRRTGCHGLDCESRRM